MIILGQKIYTRTNAFGIKKSVLYYNEGNACLFLRDCIFKKENSPPARNSIIVKTGHNTLRTLREAFQIKNQLNIVRKNCELCKMFLFKGELQLLRFQFNRRHQNI